VSKQYKMKEEIDHNLRNPALYTVFKEETADAHLERHVFYEVVNGTLESQPVLEGQRIQLFTNQEIRELDKVSWFVRDFGEDLSESLTPLT